jgi:hypothetical protein
VTPTIIPSTLITAGSDTHLHKQYRIHSEQLKINVFGCNRGVYITSSPPDVIWGREKGGDCMETAVREKIKET